MMEIENQEMWAKEGTVRALAYRSGKQAEMVEIEECKIVKGRGVIGDDRARGKRGITLLSVESWTKTMAALNADLPWHARRANVLIEGMGLSKTIGRQLRIGDVLVHVWGETYPCGEMDDAISGLKDALTPECRAGVHGEILNDGIVRVGDPVATVVGDSVS